MFFSNKIKLISPDDNVLEIGPGLHPHPRSNAFLELNYDGDGERLAQRGGECGEPDFEGKPLYTYDGGKFPFSDNEFDYIICSHVIEHVLDPVLFVSEINRVSGGRCYIEYPLITYEYLYNYNVHLNVIYYDKFTNSLKFMAKKNLGFDKFIPLSTFFQKTLECGWDDVLVNNKELFFEGVEFSGPVNIEEDLEVENFVPSVLMIKKKGRLVSYINSHLIRMGL